MEFEKVRDIIAAVLNPAKPERYVGITEQTRLCADLGATSMEIFEILLRIEDEFVIEIKENDMSEFSTVGDFMDKIRNAGR